MMLCMTWTGARYNAGRITARGPARHARTSANWWLFTLAQFVDFDTLAKNDPLDTMCRGSESIGT